MEKKDWPLFVYGGLSSCIAELSMLYSYFILIINNCTSLPNINFEKVVDNDYNEVDLYN